MSIPWNDMAVLLIEAPGGREIAAEGTLRQMVNRVAARPPSEWHRFAISLRDRRVAPFAYESDDVVVLVDALRRGDDQPR